ncbi:hypothetical protein PG996_004154 [Apiospora saccharicola]|uniref:Uncharacterized protein n=1 Tax=Apiospora saccharicola TaxID=335842 RepID=A0ABR1W3C4_9PEZI
MLLWETNNYSREPEDAVAKVLGGTLLFQQLLACTTNELNGFRFGSISRVNTALAVTVFYPGLCYFTQHLYHWTDRVYERQVQLSRKANRAELLNNPFLGREEKEKKLAATPKSPREIGFMNPIFASFCFATFALNLRAWRLDSSLSCFYYIWSPRTRIGAGVLKNIRQATTSTPLTGALAIFACSTLYKYKNEADKYQERSL